MQQESPQSESTSTPRPSPAEINPAKVTRKAHHKSRAGCKTCKTRRIKCDEAKPHCGNCMRRNVLCEYIVRTSVNSPDPPNLRHSEVELTYHWVTSTSQSLSAWSSGATVWQTLFEEIALRHEHVLHLMFALTALHLASCRPSRIEEYTTIADRHYERALASVTHDLANISIENYDAVLLSVQLICFVNWAQGPQPGEYLAFGEHGKSDWLVMFRGIRTTGTLGRENFMRTNAPAASSSTRALPSLNAPEDFRCQLTELLEHVAATSGPAARPENTRAAEILQECYESRYGGTDSEYHVVFAWLYKMPDSFLDRLQHRDAIPLIIFAHFIVLMHEMERFWYMKGWTHHVMSGIHKSLAREHLARIRWPMAKVGWILP